MKLSSAFAKDAIKFIAAFGPVIAQSVPHIYLSALRFAPRNSLVVQSYSQPTGLPFNTWLKGIQGLTLVGLHPLAFHQIANASLPDHTMAAYE